MKRKVIYNFIQAILLVILFGCSEVGPLLPDDNIITLTVTPSTLSETMNDFRITGYGWDWDDARPEGTAGDDSGAPSFGNTAFYSNVQGSAVGGPRNYSALRIDPNPLFTRSDLKMEDLKGISYWTQQAACDLTGRSWQLKIYTINEDYPDSGPWYSKRLNAETPYYSDSEWHLNSTLSNLIFDSVYDKILGDYLDLDVIGDGNQTLADIVNTFPSERILWIDIIAGYATNSPSVYSNLDGVILSLSENRSVQLNLESD